MEVAIPNIYITVSQNQNKRSTRAYLNQFRNLIFFFLASSFFESMVIDEKNWWIFQLPVIRCVCAGASNNVKIYLGAVIELMLLTKITTFFFMLKRMLRDYFCCCCCCFLTKQNNNNNNNVNNRHIRTNQQGHHHINIEHEYKFNIKLIKEKANYLIDWLIDQMAIKCQL